MICQHGRHDDRDGCLECFPNPEPHRDELSSSNPQSKPNMECACICHTDGKGPECSPCARGNHFLAAPAVEPEQCKWAGDPTVGRTCGDPDCEFPHPPDEPEQPTCDHSEWDQSGGVCSGCSQRTRPATVLRATTKAQRDSEANCAVECERNEPGGVLCLGCAERARIVALLHAERASFDGCLLYGDYALADAAQSGMHAAFDNLLDMIEGEQTNA